MGRLKKPRSCTERELLKVGVEVWGWPYFFALRCENCNETWKPKTAAAGRMARGYWKCPHGCNTGGGPKGFRLRVGGRWFPA